jgi:hypothetical protein
VTPRRLDPCPCGSGRRYKDCHGALSFESALARVLDERSQGNRAAARQALQPLLDATPPLASAWNTDGLLRMDEGDHEGAKRSFRRAVELAPELAAAHVNLGTMLLLEGDYAAGWSEYAWRTRVPNYADYANYPFGIPRWQGEPLTGRSILIHGEQGFGDTLQFARFIARLAGDGATVDVFCQPPLVRLLGTIRGVRRATGELAERPTQDFHAPIMDLGSHYLRSAQAPRWDGPYVAAAPDFPSPHVASLDAIAPPRLGYVWKGSAKHSGDQYRSLTRSQAELLTAGSRGVDLQFDTAEPLSPTLHKLAQPADWAETAALVSRLDLLVTVDTAIAHLAGAMGKEVWVLLPFAPDWRWGESGDATPWYPSMRLFRQPAIDDWESVIRAVRQALAERAGG